MTTEANLLRLAGADGYPGASFVDFDAGGLVLVGQAGAEGERVDLVGGQSEQARYSQPRS